MSEQTSLVAVEIESEPTLFPQFSPTRFVGKKGVDPGNELDLNQGVGGGGGGGGLPSPPPPPAQATEVSFCWPTNLLEQKWINNIFLILFH